MVAPEENKQLLDEHVVLYENMHKICTKFLVLNTYFIKYKCFKAFHYTHKIESHTFNQND